MFSPQSDCGMWFSMRQTVMSDSNRMTSPKDGKLDKEFATTVVTSTPAKPSDFQRVRLFRHDANVAVPDAKPAFNNETVRRPREGRGRGAPFRSKLWKCVSDLEHKLQLRASSASDRNKLTISKCNCTDGWFSITDNPGCPTCFVRRCGSCTYAA